MITSVAVGSDRTDQDPRPADVVHLDLGQAERQDLDVLASVRTTWRDPMNELDHDRFEGLTTDGLVLRSRYTYDGAVYELGLLDPVTGRTDWLPPPPVAPETVVEADGRPARAVRRRDGRRGTLLVFDRRPETWESSDVRLPAGLEVHRALPAGDRPRRPVVPRQQPRGRVRPPALVVVRRAAGWRGPTRARP